MKKCAAPVLPLCPPPAAEPTAAFAAGLDAGFKRAIDEGLIPGPRLLVTIAIISPIGGIGDLVSPSGVSLDCCGVPRDPSLPSGVAETLSDIRPVVRRMVRAGADAIKCATTGGASQRPGHGPKDRAFNLDELQTLVDEAHALDRKVMCHALGGIGLEIAVEAGVDSIEHGTYLDERPDLIDKMAARKIFFVPTVLVYDYHRKSPQPHVRQRALDLEEHHVLSIRRALDAGVKVVAGTDAGGHGHPANAGGWSAWCALACRRCKRSRPVPRGRPNVSAGMTASARSRTESLPT